MATLTLTNCDDDDPVSATTFEGDIEQRVHALINQYRQSNGLPALGFSDVIRDQCRNHSENMGKGSLPLGHDGFQARVDAIANSIALVGAAENVASNVGFSDPAQTAVDGWIESDGHRTNIRGDYNLTGIGVFKNEDNEYFFTQIFVRE